MDSGWLAAVRKYSPDKNDPLENFVTEAFCWALRAQTGIADQFLAFLRDRGFDLPAGFDSQNVKWETQVNFDGLFADMVCTCKQTDSMLVFEHKTWSELRTNQLSDYRERAKKRDWKVWVVLVTGLPQLNDQDADIALTWEDVYGCLEPDKLNNDVEKFVAEQFRLLLRTEGLGPQDPISRRGLLFHLDALDARSNFAELVKKIVAEKSLEEAVRASIPDDRSFGINSEFQDQWGRVGIQLTRPWRPGLFVGTLFDGYDHSVEPLCRRKGPDFCMILSLDADLQTAIESDLREHYSALVAELLRSINGKWEVYDHLNEAPRPNRWHPLHVRKPLTDVIGCSGADQPTKDDDEILRAQKKQIVDSSKNLLEKLFKTRAFWRLQEAFEARAHQSSA